MDVSVAGRVAGWSGGGGGLGRGEVVRVEGEIGASADEASSNMRRRA